ncbi:MAG TPA: hypothetical protein VH969_23160 [Actinophytocola sp.]|jgi:hypothetical protein|uniref:hypothetical protein n=1 Tax=Actinophytocola sp. TaxID=1872138 RepID=UPI002F93CA15
MATELPVRIEFSLPKGWQATPPDEAGAPGVAFVALHPAPARGMANGFTANLTIAGEIRDPDLPMAAIADESVHRLENVAGSVRVRERTAVGPDDSPGLTQVLDIELSPGRQIVQCQVYVSMHDVDDPRRRAVLELVLTCTPEQLEEVFADFQAFVQSVRPAAARS